MALDQNEGLAPSTPHYGTLWEVIRKGEFRCSFSLVLFVGGHALLPPINHALI